jgi:phosphoglucosamine mutase
MARLRRFDLARPSGIDACKIAGLGYSRRLVERKYFGTDGVRGVVGETLTVDLVERLGKAATLWSDGGRVFIGRDTRVTGPELEEAFARGVVAAGGHALLAGVLPTPAVALLALDLGVVISASHNPPEYNGVKFFDGQGEKLTDADEAEIEALLDAEPAADPGSIDRIGVASYSYVEHVLEQFGSDLSGLRVGVDCAHGAYSGIGPAALRKLGADAVAIANDADGELINVNCGATDLRALSAAVVEQRLDLGVAFDGDGDRMLAVDERGDVVDGDQILAILALHLKVDLVAVTVMANLGLHKLMEEHGIRVVTTDVGDRYVLEALRREGGVLGGEESGHLICLDRHVTGDGLVAAVLLCRALEGRPLSEAAAVLQKYPQARVNVPVRDKRIPADLRERIDELAGEGRRVLVRPSGTEPVVRVLAEAATQAEAEDLSASIAALVQRELG